MVNGCRPRNSSTICSAVIHVTRPFSLHCVLMSNRNGFNSVSNSSTTTVHCARVHLTGVTRRLVTSLRGRAISFISGCSNARGVPSIVPAGVPGLLIGNSSNVTMNVTAGVPPRGLARIVGNYLTCVSSRSVDVRKLVRRVPNPSFPATTVVGNHHNVRRTCHANHNGMCVHTHTRIRISTGAKHRAVVIRRVPCRMGGTHLVRGVTRLMGRGHIRNVDTLHSRSSGSNVHVIVRIGHSTINRIILGGLCSRARLRISFNVGVITLRRNRPGVVGLGSVVTTFIHRHHRIIAHHAVFRLHGTHSHTRVLRTLTITLTGVSPVVRLVHRTPAPTRTGATLITGP